MSPSDVWRHPGGGPGGHDDAEGPGDQDATAADEPLAAPPTDPTARYAPPPRGGTEAPAPSYAPPPGGYLADTYPAHGYPPPPPDDADRPGPAGPATAYPRGAHPASGYPGSAYPGAASPGAGAAYPATAYPGTGYPTTTYSPWAGNTPMPTDGLAIGAMVTGLVALLTCVLSFLGPVAVGLGIAALRRISRTGARGRGLAITGIVTGGLATLVLLTLAMAFASDSGTW